MVASIVYLALGLVVTVRSVIAVVADPKYWDPVTTVDFVAIWTWSLAFLLTGMAVPLLARDARADRTTRVAAAVVLLAAMITAIANGVEDGAGIKAWGSIYVLGSLTTLGGLLVVIGMLMRDGRNRHAGAVALWLAGLAMTTWGLGVLALAGSFVAIDARRRRDVVVA